jgi:hypothetical protein
MFIIEFKILCFFFLLINGNMLNFWTRVSSRRISRIFLSEHQLSIIFIYNFLKIVMMRIVSHKYDFYMHLQQLGDWFTYLYSTRYFDFFYHFFFYFIRLLYILRLRARAHALFIFFHFFKLYFRVSKRTYVVILFYNNNDLYINLHFSIV